MCIQYVAKSVDQIYYYSTRLKYKYGSIFIGTNKQFIDTENSNYKLVQDKDLSNMKIIIGGITCPKDHKYHENMIVDPFNFKYYSSNVIIYDHIYEQSLHNEAADKRRSSAICYLGFKVPPPPFPYKISFSSYSCKVNDKELINYINKKSLALSLPSRKKSEFDQNLNLRNHLLNKLQDCFAYIDDFNSMHTHDLFTIYLLTKIDELDIKDLDTLLIDCCTINDREIVTIILSLVESIRSKIKSPFTPTILFLVDKKSHLKEHYINNNLNFSETRIRFSNTLDL